MHKRLVDQLKYEFINLQSKEGDSFPRAPGAGHPLSWCQCPWEADEGVRRLCVGLESPLAGGWGFRTLIWGWPPRAQVSVLSWLQLFRGWNPPLYQCLRFPTLSTARHCS